MRLLRQARGKKNGHLKYDLGRKVILGHILLKRKVKPYDLKSTVKKMDALASSRAKFYWGASNRPPFASPRVLPLACYPRLLDVWR